MTGPNPVDRGKTGSKIHVLSDQAGLPLSVGVSAANTNDAYALKPLVMAIPAIKSRRGPRRRKPGKLHADKAYDQQELRGLGPRPGHRRPHRPQRHRIQPEIG
jgi:transposase